MINGLEGIPGSGKSYEAVVYHVLEALKRGRMVITNLPLQVALFAAIDPAYASLIDVRVKPMAIRGTWDANRVDDKGNGNAFVLTAADIAPAESVPVFGHVWDYHTEWKHPDTGQGPLFVIDECHLALPPVGTDVQVIQWFKLHRHFNVDVLLLTQSFRDMNQTIARLMAMLVRCRKADILGKKDRYIRRVFSGYRGGLVSNEERKYLPQYFPLYRSHTQGNSVAEAGASDVVPFIVKWRRFVWAYWVFTVLILAWAFWPADKAKNKVRNVAEGQAWYEDAKRNAGRPLQLTTPDGTATGALRAPAAAASASALQEPEPYAGKLVHLTGVMRMGGRVIYSFAVSSGGQRIASLTSDDLHSAGYTWHPLTDCAGTLRYQSKAYAVTCDAPAFASGAQDRPIVIAQPVARPS